jgi:hypothetical protein
MYGGIMELNKNTMVNKQAICDWISKNMNHLDDGNAKKRVEELKKTLGPCHENCDTPEKRVACFLVNLKEILA